MIRRSLLALIAVGAAAVPVQAQQPVSECGVLTGAGTSWYLTRDLVAPRSTGNGISLADPGMTLDLRGHTITYDADPSGIPNGGFEEARADDPDLPAGWDLTDAHGRVRLVSTSLLPMTGSRFLEFVDAQAGDAIRSAWVELPPDRPCSASFVLGFARGSFSVMPTMRVLVERSTGEVVYDGTHGSSPSEPSLLSQRFPFRTPDVEGETYRLSLVVVDPPTEGQFHHRFAVDEVHLRTDGNYGIEVQSSATGVTIENGRVVQGAGGGPFASAIRLANGTRLSDLEVETHGIESMAVFGPNFIRDVEIAQCDLRAFGPAAFRWMDLKNTVSLGGSSPGTANNWIHDNLIVGGNGLGCIRVSGGSGNDPPPYRIENNEMWSTCALTDHHALVVYRTPNAVVRGNTIHATGGQGILLSSGFGGARVESNLIQLDGIKPNVEFGLISFDAIRMNDYGDPANRSDEVRIRDNTIIVGGGLDPWYEPGYGQDCGVVPTPSGCAGKALNGIMHAANGVGTRLSGNLVTVRMDDPTVIGSCWEIGRSDPAGGHVLWRGNTCDSNQRLMVIGGYSDAARNSTFVETTLRRSAPFAGADYTLYSRGSQASIEGVSFVSTRFEDGASLDPGQLFMRTNVPWSFSQAWRARIRVVRPDGRPVTGVQVVVRDLSGTPVASGATGPAGWLGATADPDGITLIEWVRSGPAWVNSSTVVAHTPHTVRVGTAGPAREIVADRDRTVVITVRDPGPRGIAVDESAPESMLSAPVTGLRAVVPNPSNPRTRIEFELARGGSTRVDVFDLRGSHVRTLVSRELSPGVHRVDWDGRDDAGRSVSSGVYFVRLRSGARQDVRKLSLLR